MIEQIDRLGEMWWDWMWPMFWQVAVLIALIGVVDLMMRKRVWPQVRYALWLLVLVKLVLPPTFSLPTSVTSNLQPLARHALLGQRGGIPGFLNIEGDLTRVTGSADASTGPVGGLKQTEKPLGSTDKAAAGDKVTSASAAQLSWQVYLMLAWLLGALVLGAWLMARHRQLRSPHLGQADTAALLPSLEKLLADTAKKLNLRRLPNVILSDIVACPAVLGVFRPTLLLPREHITGLPQNEAEHVLLHELAHIKRRDLWVNSIFMVLQIVYWFNPLLWFVRRQLRHLRELCCDATVARILREKTTDYRQTILEHARGLLDKPVEPVMGILGLFEDSNRLLARLKWLEKKTWKYRRLRVATILALIVFMSVCVLPMAKAQKSEIADTAITKEIITDPETGLQFRKVASLTGETDIFIYSAGLAASPSGKFILNEVQVVPLEGGKPFRLVEFPAYRGSWSPDGKKVAFYSGGIWMIPVSPDTAKPTGPPKKLIEGDYWYGYHVAWSPDSERFAYASEDRHLWTCSLEDGSKVRMLDEPAYPLSCSPDGKWIACRKDDRHIWLIPSAGGTSRKLVEYKRDLGCWWSPDSKWILGRDGRELTFVRIADVLSVEVTLPKEVGKFLSWPPDGKKMRFYKPSYDWAISLKIVPASGGTSLYPLKEQLYSGIEQRWTPDSKFVATYDWEHYWVVPVPSGKPFALELNVDVEGEPLPELISPDARKLLFSTETDGKRVYWIVPISIEQGRTTGTPVKIFDEPKVKSSAWSLANRFKWSPDGNKLAIGSHGDTWIASTDGSPPVLLTQTPEGVFAADWGPDGKRMLLGSHLSSTNKSILYLWEVPDGEPKKMIEIPGSIGYREADDLSVIAYTVGDGEKIVLSVVAVPGGEPKKLMEFERDRHKEFSYALSPNGQELAVVLDDKVSGFSLPDGTRREIADFDNPAWSRYPSIYWSPDSQTIALLLYSKPGTYDDPDSYERSRIFMVPARGGKWTELAADDPGDKYSLHWSPDVKWIAYSSDGEVKTRDEGVIWEVEIDSFLRDAAEKAESASSPEKD